MAWTGLWWPVLMVSSSLVPDGQTLEQDRTSRPVDGHWSVPVPGTGLSIQAWTDGTRGWWHILPSLEIYEQAQSLDDPDLTGLPGYQSATVSDCSALAELM